MNEVHGTTVVGVDSHISRSADCVRTSFGLRLTGTWFERSPLRRLPLVWISPIGVEADFVTTKGAAADATA